jgi:hypothetical protein
LKTRILPDYEWIGLGRDGGNHGEFMAVFYRVTRFEPLEFDHFWLSDAPNVVASSTWGSFPSWQLSSSPTVNDSSLTNEASEQSGQGMP